MKTLPSNPYRNKEKYTTNALYEMLKYSEKWIKPRYEEFKDVTIEMHEKMIREALRERVGDLEDKLALVESVE